MINGQTHLLLVDDNDGDARLAIEVLSESSINYQITHVRDGVEAMNFLLEQDYHDQARLPDAILLDLNMPRMDGRDVLAELRAHNTWSSIPIIVFTISQNQQDVHRCYELNANCYVKKPVDYDDFVDIIRSLEQFWFKTAILPSQVSSQRVR